MNHSSATVANITGTFTQAYQLGNGTVDEIDGLYSEVGNASTGGTVETVAAGKFIIDNDIESGPGGTTTNTYGVWVTSPGSNPGPETHLHGIHIDDQTVGGSNDQDPVEGEWLKQVLQRRIPLGSIDMGDQSGPLICTGTGIPNGVVTAPVGSLYLRQDGGTSSTLYVKESGGLYKFWLGRKMTKKRLVLDCFLFDFISFGVRWCRVEQGRTSGDIRKPLLVPVTETAPVYWRARAYSIRKMARNGDLPYRRMGNRWLVPASNSQELRQWEFRRTHFARKVTTASRRSRCTSCIKTLPNSLDLAKRREQRIGPANFRKPEGRFGEK